MPLQSLFICKEIKLKGVKLLFWGLWWTTCFKDAVHSSTINSMQAVRIQHTWERSGQTNFCVRLVVLLKITI